MLLFSEIKIAIYLAISCTFLEVCGAITMQQFEQSLDMMRNGCAPKFKVPLERLDRMRHGDMTEDHEDLKCYVRCVVALSGVVTKKGDFSFPKAIAQIPIILPAQIQETARNSLEVCKGAQKDLKESCDKIFAVTKCVRDFDPDSFTFP